MTVDGCTREEGVSINRESDVSWSSRRPDHAVLLLLWNGGNGVVLEGGSSALFIFIVVNRVLAESERSRNSCVWGVSRVVCQVSHMILAAS